MPTLPLRLARAGVRHLLERETGAAAARCPVPVGIERERLGMKGVSCIGCGVVLHLELLKTNPVIRHWTPVSRASSEDEGPYVAMLCPFCRHEQREADATSRVDA